MPDLSEFKKVEVSVDQTTESVKSPIKEPVNAQPATTVDEKRDIEVSKKETVSVVKKNPEVISKPKNNTKPKPPSKSTVVPRPQIQFEEPIHDFGEITEGDIIEHKFAFKNTGKAELVIKSAKASCGCTNPSYPFLGVAPGETGFIGVTYNSVSKDGPQKPEVTITTNVDDSSIVLYLSGIVLPKEKTEESKQEEEGFKD